MPPISPHLDALLTSWITRGHDLRQEVAFQRDLLEPLSMAASGNRLAIRERRRRDWQRLEETLQESHARWDERLHRIEEWNNALTDLKQQEAQLHQFIVSILWLSKAHAHRERFTRHLEQRAERLRAEQVALHDRLTAWSELLQERRARLEELKQKETASEAPLFVSRARKQPEIDFMNEQRAVNETLGKEMQQLRSALRQTLGRLQKAFAAVESRAGDSQILFALNKQEIETALQQTERTLQQRREEILSDALIYETGRSALNRIQEILRGLRCLEDYSQRPKAGWKKFFLIR